MDLGRGAVSGGGNPPLRPIRGLLFLFLKTGKRRTDRIAQLHKKRLILAAKKTLLHACSHAKMVRVHEGGEKRRGF